MDLQDGDVLFCVDLHVVDGTLGPVSVQKALLAGFDPGVPATFGRWIACRRVV